METNTLPPFESATQESNSSSEDGAENPAGHQHDITYYEDCMCRLRLLAVDLFREKDLQGAVLAQGQAYICAVKVHSDQEDQICKRLGQLYQQQDHALHCDAASWENHIRDLLFDAEKMRRNGELGESVAKLTRAFFYSHKVDKPDQRNQIRARLLRAHQEYRDSISKGTAE